MFICLPMGKDVSLSSHTQNLAERLCTVRAKITNVADPIITVIANMVCRPQASTTQAPHLPRPPERPL